MAGQNRNFKLTLKDVRCFAGEQHFNIRPLTFLIGENSTGKTTVMSCFSAIYSFISHRGYSHPHADPDFNFNKNPYFMGSFVDIVNRSKAEKAKETVKNFEISISRNNDIKYNVCFREKEGGSEPVVNQASIDFKDILFSYEEDKKRNFCVKAKKKGTNAEIFDNKGKGSGSDHTFFLYMGDPFFFSYLDVGSNNQRHNIEELKELEKLRESWRSHTRELLADEIFNMAPVRSKPQRTYNPIKEASIPEGAEIPVRLRDLSAQDKTWPAIRKKLTAFGKASGLFSDIEVRQFGQTKGDPFQLQFQIRGIKSNIIDAGYGLSQILPLLARLFDSRIQRDRFSTKSGTRFLLQQPEVHLHPAAQAELASLFVQSAAKANNSFLIETHSDFILDRTRIEVRKGEIAPDQVSIIYFEPVQDRVKAHNLSLDKQGNLIGAPEGYRKFFIKETDRLLGFED